MCIVANKNKRRVDVRLQIDETSLCVAVWHRCQLTKFALGRIHARRPIDSEVTRIRRVKVIQILLKRDSELKK